MHRQLYFALRAAILEGRLGEGARLPSSRALATQLTLSRNTVVAAIDQLVAEGFVEGRQGSGMRVVAQPAPPSLDRRTVQSRATRSISRRARELAALDLPLAHGPVLPLAPRYPDLVSFPHREWSRLLARRWRRPQVELMASNDPAGYLPLRQSIAEHLGRVRAVRCTADDVIITAGAQQGLDLAVRVLLEPDDLVMVEDPGYGGLKGVIRAAGAQPVPVPVDEQGFDPILGERLGPTARLACVTPSHQFPSGATMPLERRLALIQWAERVDGWIMEDDYDGDFRYSGPPLASLQGLDGGGRTIYCGTFSKSMFPALRLGWLVVPRDLLTAFLALRQLADVAPSVLTQTAMADFMADGLYAAHIRRLRALYAERRAVLLKAAHDHLHGMLEVTAGDAGTHVIGWLPDGWDDHEIVIRARRAGLGPIALSNYRTMPGRPGLVIGYGHTSTSSLPECLRRLATVLRG